MKNKYHIYNPSTTVDDESIWDKKQTLEKCCHGCFGRGWVETSNGVVICPICHGSGVISPRKRFNDRMYFTCIKHIE